MTALRPSHRARIAVAVAALSAVGCSGGGDDAAGLTSTTVSPTTTTQAEEGSTTTETEEGPTTIEGDEATVTIEGGEAAVSLTEESGLRNILTVAGDEVYVQQFEPNGGHFVIARVDLATADVDRSEQWPRASIDTPPRVTRDHLWWGSPESTDPAVRGVRGFSVLDRSTLAVVGHYPLPAGEFAIALVTIGETVYEAQQGGTSLGGCRTSPKSSRLVTAAGAAGDTV